MAAMSDTNGDGMLWNETLRQWVPAVSGPLGAKILDIHYAAETFPMPAQGVLSTSQTVDLWRIYSTGTASAWAGPQGLPADHPNLQRPTRRVSDSRWEFDDEVSGGIRFPSGAGGVVTIHASGYFTAEFAATDASKIQFRCDVVGAEYDRGATYEQVVANASWIGWHVHTSIEVDEGWGGRFGINPTLNAVSASVAQSIYQSILRVYWSPA